ncbi:MULTISPECIES: hypothetical protein [Streptomyces]|uniref:hypothetical protein n=1 Tax=Streptomyces TaxID=1883 RepID=UPI00379EEC90
MATVGELSARYANFLVHPLLPGPGVCQICRGTAKPGYPHCRPCQEARRVLGAGVADAVVPVSLAVKSGQYANELWRYKNAAGAQQQYFRTGLAAVLWHFLALHESCIAAHCEVSAFDVVTTVPSTSGRADHPLRTMVADMIGATRARHRDLLKPAADAPTLGRTASASRYAAAGLLGENVLLIDDTWASGQHAQSAAAALKAAGAGTVAVVVLGRHLNLTFGETASLVEQARLRSFSWGVCALRHWQHTRA